VSVAASLVFVAQLAASGLAGAQAPHSPESARSAPIAVAVTTRARVIRPTIIAFESEAQLTPTDSSAAPPQRERDRNGTVWIEFS